MRHFRCAVSLSTAVALALPLFLLQACAGSSPATRSASAVALAASQGWQARVLAGPMFDVQAFVPPALAPPAGQAGSHRLTIYIEGDGLAWLDRQTPSFAPTPADPVALRLAMAHAGGAVAYLGRPCQYTLGTEFRNCHPRYWGSHRFSTEVLRSMDHAVHQLKRASGARELVLVGYSGGAAVAALLSAGRSDVAMWVTVAGTLDTGKWTRQLRLSPLSGSRNPMDEAARLRTVPQWHFVGAQDKVMPRSVLESFLRMQGAAGQPSDVVPQVRVMEGFDHRCCWDRVWPELSQSFAQSETLP